MYNRRRLPIETPKIEVPTLDQNQIMILSALFVLNATDGYFEAERWLAEFESANLLPPGELGGFLDFFVFNSEYH